MYGAILKLLLDVAQLEDAVVQHVKETGHTDLRCHDDQVAMCWGVVCTCGEGWQTHQLPVASMWIAFATDDEDSIRVYNLRDHYLKAAARQARLAFLVDQTTREVRPVTSAWARLLDD